MKVVRKKYSMMTEKYEHPQDYERPLADYEDHLNFLINEAILHKDILSHPVKRNNVKNRKSDTGSGSVDVVRISDSDHSCFYCGCREPLLHNWDSDEWGCGQCGTVDPSYLPQHDVSRNIGVESDTLEEFEATTRCDVSTKRVDPCVNYWRERLSQWLMQEPPIPHEDAEKLLNTYLAGRQRYGDDLPKDTVRRLVIDSGLSPRVYVEKWLRIRVLCGAASHPVPSHQIVRHCDECFMEVRKLWRNKKDEIIRLFRRRSLPNYNYMMRHFLLIHSVAAYELHAPWFPQVVTKLADLDLIWRWVCEQLLIPFYDYNDGKRMKRTFII